MEKRSELFCVAQKRDLGPKLEAKAVRFGINTNKTLLTIEVDQLPGMGSLTEMWREIRKGTP